MTKKNKNILIAAIVLAAGVAVAVPMAVRHYSKPNFAKMNPRQIREYFDSNEFRDANENVRQEIRGQMREAMQARMTAQVNDYFALPEGSQRTVYLDKIIDEMQARRAEFLSRRDPNRPPDANGPRGFGPPDANRPRFGQRSANAGQRPRINLERMRTRSERISADTRVKMIQFRMDMQKRMEQRGIQGPMMGRGGPGGPGGFGRGGPPP